MPDAYAPPLVWCIIITMIEFIYNIIYIATFRALTLLVWRKEVHLTCKTLGVGLLVLII